MYGKCSKISNTFLFLFSNKMLVFRTGIYKMLVRVANKERPQSDSFFTLFSVGLSCLPRPYSQTTSVPNFRIFTIFYVLFWSQCDNILCMFYIAVGCTEKLNHRANCIIYT